MKRWKGFSLIDLFFVDPVCSFNVRIGSGISRRNQIMLISIESTLGREFVLNSNMRMQSVREFQSIVRLNNLDRKWIEKPHLRQKIHTRIGSDIFINQFALDSSRHINCRILIDPPVFLLKPLRYFILQPHVFHVDLNLFSRQIFGRLIMQKWLLSAFSFTNQSFPFQNLVYPSHRKMQRIAVFQQKPDIFRPLICPFADLHNEINDFLRIAPWACLRPSGICQTPMSNRNPDPFPRFTWSLIYSFFPIIKSASMNTEFSAYSLHILALLVFPKPAWSHLRQCSLFHFLFDSV